MKDLKTIIEEAYTNSQLLRGGFKKTSEVLENVNATLCENGESPITLEDMTEEIKKHYPLVKEEPNYIQEDESFPAIRLLIGKVERTPQLTDGQIRDIRNKVSSIIETSCRKESGWYELVKIGPALMQGGYNYKEAGFSSLGIMLRAVFPEFQEEDRGDVAHPNQKFVKLYTEDNSTNRVNNARQDKNLVPTRRWKKETAFDKLMNFAVFPQRNGIPGFTYAIQQLKEKALSEDWYYGGQENDRGNHPILQNYILMTFERLLAEDEEHRNDVKWKKKIRTTDQYAMFNTGLVDHLYEPVYALFNRNKNTENPRKWVFWTFVKSNDREHQNLTRIFGTDLPTPAHYYNLTSELVYDIRREIGSFNWDHFMDNCCRLPLEFLRENGPKDFDYDQVKNREFYRKLSQAIKADSRSMNRIKNRINDAIEYAKKRVRWNFKTAIPIYYPGHKQISLLLPLSLMDDDTIDVALVLEATDSKAYIAHTILTLKMAYTNARLITRPDSDWLTVKNINTMTNNDDDDTVE